MVSALNIIGSDRSLQEHWLRRVVAIFIDSAITYVIGLALTWSTITLLSWNLTIVWTLLWPTYSGLLLFLYYFVLESASGSASIGKRVMGLRVISLSSDMDIGKAAMRNISKLYTPFLFLDWVIGFVTDGDPKQKWMDLVAGTTVVITSQLTDRDQHTYQSQQSKYAPPPAEPYQPVRHDNAYQYPAEPKKAEAPVQQSKAAPFPSAEPAVCVACGGRMAETGAGRLKCIRCGKIQ